MARLAGVLVLVLVWMGCGGDDATAPDGGSDSGADAGRVYVPEPFAPTAETIAYCGVRDDAAIEQQITTWLAELTLAEKVSLMHGSAFALVDGAWRTGDVDRLGIPGFAMLDGPRGLSAFTGKPGTAFPVAAMRGATWDPALEERVGAAMARELRSAGANVLLAPTINVLRHPRWGRAQETYSEDTHHMGEMGVAFIRGVQSEGVLASAKHFAANSIEDTRHRVDVVLDERTLREIYLPHFRRAVVDAQVASVMSAYNSVNGFHADLNEHLLAEILKEEWRFSGFVESDWLLGTHADVASVNAGLDVEMPTGANFTRLVRAVSEGEIDEHVIDRSVRRILRAQLCYDLERMPGGVDDATARETPEHLALAREVARRGIVLLANQPPDGAAPGAPPVLPFDASIASVAVMGRASDVENIGDSGSSNVITSSVVTALEGLVARAGATVTVTHVPGTTFDVAAEAAVRASDVVVIVTGLLADDEGEATVGAGDRADLLLPAEEIALIEAVAAIHPAVVVVLEGGSALLTAPWDAQVEALLFAFYPGSEGGHALAEILFGDEAPSGRLPFSMPAAEADLPPFDNVAETVTYGYFHGYRHLEREGTAPRHAFGFGLTYTTFELTDLRLASATLAPDGALEATVTVTNTGSVAAIETVQLYVSATASRIERAPRDLRAFAQVELESGASADVVLRVPAADLAFWDEAADGWEVERLSYRARVGSLEAVFTIE